tara:strand:+ start:81 stop:299 length:219 start_codon:yes stop_codon:yes gene_type:complete
MKSFDKFIEEMAASVEKDDEPTALDKAKSIFAKNREQAAANAKASKEKSKSFGGVRLNQHKTKFTSQSGERQ